MAVSLADLLAKSDRNLYGVHPRIRDHALELVRRSYEKGINVIITSGLRSMTAQARLYGQGRSSYIYKGVQYGNPKLPVVTQARPGSSIHNYGLAIDYALMTESGQIIWDLGRDVNANGVRDWFEVAAIGKSMGFMWGGDWTRFKDYPHLDWQKGISLAQLSAGSRPTIPPVTVKDWHEKGDIGPGVQAIQTKLNKLGYKLEVDSVWGPNLQEAVLDFQKQNKLIPDGYFGTNTSALLDKLVAAKEAAEAKRKAEAAKVAADKKAAAAKAASDMLNIISKGESDMLNMPDWQKTELKMIFKKAREIGLFDSERHEQQIEDGTMTLDTVVFLMAAIVGTLINNGERIR